MLEELKGKEVTIQLGTATGFSDRLKGRVLDIGESWIKIQTSKKIQYVNLEKIGRIITDL